MAFAFADREMRVDSQAAFAGKDAALRRYDGGSARGMEHAGSLEKRRDIGRLPAAKQQPVN